MRNYYLNHYYNNYIYNDLAKYKIFYVGNNSTWEYVSAYFIQKSIYYSSLGLDVSELNQYDIRIFVTIKLNSWSYTDLIPMAQYSTKYNSFELGINKCGGGFNSDDTFNNLYVQYMIVGWKI